MQSDVRPIPASYLHNVLSDGAKPFLYRSSVRSLLGIPDSGRNEIAFFSTMPPVGFTYPNFYLMGEPYTPPYSSDLAVSSAWGEREINLKRYENIATKDTQQFQPERMAHSISQATENGGTELIPKGMVQTNTATPELDQQNVNEPAPASGQVKSSMEPAKVSERPGTVFESAIIDIPGASSKFQNFPALSPSKRSESFSGMTEERSQPLLSPKDSRPGSVTRVLSEGSGIFTSPPLQRKNREGGKKFDEAFNQSSADTLSFNSHPTLSRGREFAGMVSGLQTAKEQPVSTGQENKLSSAPTINIKHSSQKVTQISPGTGNTTSRTVDRIEQLRNAVHELAIKQSPSREQTRDEAPIQQQQLPSPVQQTVIVKQPASPPGIPHAFWERSYLGRTRVRILR